MLAVSMKLAPSCAAGALITSLVAFAGCGGRLDTSALETVESPAPRSPKTPQKSPPQTSSPEAEEREAGVCPASSAFDEGTYDARIGGLYRSPAAPDAACTAEEVKTFQANMGKASVYLKTGLSERCVACVFTSVTAAAWGPIVVFDDGDESFANIGACHALVNGSDRCGRAVQYDDFCAREACEACEANKVAPCFGAAQKGVCKASHDAIVEACPNLASSTARCGTTLVSHVRFLCAPGT